MIVNLLLHRCSTAAAGEPAGAGEHLLLLLLLAQLIM